jgi:hypothetical protein
MVISEADVAAGNPRLSTQGRVCLRRGRIPLCARVTLKQLSGVGVSSGAVHWYLCLARIARHLRFMHRNERRRLDIANFRPCQKHNDDGLYHMTEDERVKCERRLKLWLASRPERLRDGLLFCPKPIVNLPICQAHIPLVTHSNALGPPLAFNLSTPSSLISSLTFSCIFCWLTLAATVWRRAPLEKSDVIA